MSLLSWERGLKSYRSICDTDVIVSLLSWERGLKYIILFGACRLVVVAPLVGAWIEIVVISPLLTAFLRRSSRGSVD